MLKMLYSVADMSNSDPGLSSKRLQQVDCLLNELKNYMDSALILSSPALRARETAEIISQKKQYKVVEELCERNLGTWEGLNVHEIKVRRKNDGLSLLDLTQDWVGCPDVEQDQSVWRRSWNAIVELSENSATDTTIVVTHAGVIKSFVYEMLRIDHARCLAFRITLGGIILFEQREDVYEMQKLWPNPLAESPRLV